MMTGDWRMELGAMAEQALQLMTVDEFLALGRRHRHPARAGGWRRSARWRRRRCRIGRSWRQCRWRDLQCGLRNRRPCRPRSRSRHPHRRAYHVAGRYRGHLPSDRDAKSSIRLSSSRCCRRAPERTTSAASSSTTRRCRACTEIWMVDCERRWVQLWRRDGERLARTGLRRQCRVRERRRSQARVTLDELYADSGL